MHNIGTQEYPVWLPDNIVIKPTDADSYQTPLDVAQYMAGLLPVLVKEVLEPTEGEGNVTSALSEYNVTAPKDYFLLDENLKFDAVVMNPPFSEASAILTNAPDYYKGSGMGVGYKILDECMEKAPVIIALMPWYTISDSDVRMRKLIKFGLSSITVLPRKTFDYARIQTCIIQLIKGWDKATLFHSYEHINQRK